MKNENNIPNSLVYVQALDKNIKYNLLSNNTSSICQLNATNSGTFSSSNLLKTNLKRKNKGSIFGNFFKKENERNTPKNIDNDFFSIKKNFEREILAKYGPKNYFKIEKKKHDENNFDSKKMISPQFFLKLLDDIEKKTPEGQSLYKIYKIHSIVSVLILINVICSFIDNILNKEKSYSYFKKLLINQPLMKNALKELKNRKLTNIENFLRTISIITAILNVILLTIKEYFVQKYNINFQNLKRRITICIICSFCFPPNKNPIYIIEQNDCIYPLFLVDIYFLLNLSKIYIVNYINVGNTKYGTLLTQSICRNYSIKPGHLFSIRARIQDNPFIYSLLIYALMSIITFFLLRSFEFATFMIYKTQNENKELSFGSSINAIWFIIIISFGVAFGDYYPKTNISRLLTFYLIIFLFVIISFFLKKIMTFTIMSESEKKVYVKMKKLYSPENLKYKAVNVIFFLLKIRESKILLKEEENEELKSFLRKKLSVYTLMLNRHIKNFDNNDKIADAFSIPVDDLLITLENKIRENITTFENSFDKLEKINNDLDDLKNMQHQINLNLYEILNNEITLGNYIVEINNKSVLTKLKPKSKKHIYGRFSRDITVNNEEIMRKLSKNLHITVMNKKKHHDVPLKKGKKQKIFMNQTKITEKKEENQDNNSSNATKKSGMESNIISKKNYLDDENFGVNDNDFYKAKSDMKNNSFPEKINQKSE